MARATSLKTAPEGPDTLQPGLAFVAQIFDGIYQAQKFQIDVLSRWQQSLSPALSPFPDWMGMQLEFLKRAQAQVEDMRDAMVAHWAGGVPIDA